MRARAKWIEGMAFLGESGSGHAVIMDGAPDHGGRDIGIRPLEMLLIGLAGCTAFDVVLILKKSRADVIDVEVTAEAERAASEPRVFTAIALHYRVTGRKLGPDKVKRAIDLSQEKYCSASIMLGATAKLTHSFEVIEAEA